MFRPSHMTCQLPRDSFTFPVFSLLKDVIVVVWATLTATAG